MADRADQGTATPSGQGAPPLVARVLARVQEGDFPTTHIVAQDVDVHLAKAQAALQRLKAKGLIENRILKGTAIWSAK